PADRGVAISVAELARTNLVSNTNWLCGRDDGRNLALNGKRTNVSGWRNATGQDTRSVSTVPPTFDHDFHVVSRNFGAGLGQALGFERDFVGVPVAARAPDVGAYQRSM